MSKRPFFPLSLSLLLVLSLGVTVGSCSQTAPAPKASSSKAAPVETWIRQHATSFKTAEPGGSDEDLQPFQQIVGNATIVGLGEATHGTHEFFRMKQRLLEFLVTKMGFTIFALENGWDESRQIDQYVLTGQGNLMNLLHADLYSAWHVQEYRDLIEWIRAYDADPAHATKVHFAGIDCYNISQAAFDEVVVYVRGVDPQQTNRVQALYAGIRPSSTTPVFVDYSFSALPQSTKQHYRDNAQQVFDLLKAHQTVYESHSSKEAFALALQNAQVILQYSILATLIPPSGTLVTARPAYIYRDACMAENASWLHDHEGSTAKIVLSAHNLHIANLPSYFGSHEKNMGAFLRNRYQENYRPIGTSFYQGAFRNFSTRPSSIDTLPAPSTDSYNYTLGHVGLPQYILDLRETPAGPVTKWVQGPGILRAVGVAGEDLSQVMRGSLQEQFDVIIHFQKITASHLLS